MSRQVKGKYGARSITWLWGGDIVEFNIFLTSGITMFLRHFFWEKCSPDTVCPELESRGTISSLRSLCIQSGSPSPSSYTWKQRKEPLLLALNSAYLKVMKVAALITVDIMRSSKNPTGSLSVWQRRFWFGFWLLSCKPIPYPDY